MHNWKAHDDRQLLSMGTRAFSFLGMSLLVFEEQSEVFKGIAISDMKLNWARWNQRLQQPQSNSSTPWPSELKVTGKMIWDWEPQIALLLTPHSLAPISHSVFSRKVKSRCPRWIIDNFSIFPSSFVPFSFLIWSQVSIFACRAAQVSERQVWDEEGPWEVLYFTDQRWRGPSPPLETLEVRKCSVAQYSTVPHICI